MEERKENILHNPAHTVNELAKSPGTAPPTNEWNKVRKLALRHLNRFVSLEAKVLKGTTQTPSTTCVLQAGACSKCLT